MSKTSVIIVNWQNIQDTINCVKSIRDTCDIVVVNNGGSSLNRQFPSQIHLIQNETNYGFARANNQGIKYAMDRFSPDYILLLNADTIALPGFLAPLVSLMELDNKIAIVQPKILRLDSTNIIDSAGQIAYKYGSVRDIGIGEKDGPLFQERKEVFGACAAAALYRTSALKNAGLFDEKLFSLFEDVDLSWRLRLKGYSVFYEPLSVVHHQRGVSGKLTAKNKIIRRFYGFRNCLAVTLKYYPLSSVLIFLPVHIYRLLIALFFKYRYKIKDPFFTLISDSIKERTIIQKSVLIKTIQEKWIK